MNLLDYITSCFKGSKKEVVETSDKAACPVCWGYQEYDYKIRTILRDKHVDVKNHRDNYMKVQQFMVQHVDGVKYRRGRLEK